MNGKFNNPAVSPAGEKKRGGEVPLDFKNCVYNLGGDRKTVLGLINEFLETIDNQRKVLIGALDMADCETVRKEAHSIKGGAAVLSAHPLMAAAALLEEAGKAGDLVEGSNGLRVLEKEIALLMNYCNELNNGID